MAKNYKGYDDIKEIDISQVAEESNVDTVYRTLFIGLGGTGGEVLCKLTSLMSPEEKERAHIIYLDMDTKDVNRLKAKGMNAVCISSADTVSNVMRYLGEHDGVKDWLPHSERDTEFLSSQTDTGASQFRMKSRLCLAKYLKDNANELKSLLDEICSPGNLLANETLRVMIVSSVAGGTGAGTFIQMALYLREYFRSNGHRDIAITGLFACPDLFVRSSETTTAKKENMYSNAYAAVRELNAMNLAVNLSANARKQEGYGKNINIAIHTVSEGALFDSNDPETAKNANNKPFNLLYFVDVNNTDGGLLRSLEQYYDVMADIVYTRLYSPIEAPLRSDENNELSIHAKYPTAIYGSAGYGRIIYPYHGILNYLAVRKTFDELDYTWSILDNEWTKYKRTKQMIANGSGIQWSETSEERGKKYISDMLTKTDASNSPLRAYRGMIRDGESAQDRAEQFVTSLINAMKSGNGIDKGSVAQDSIFGLHNDEDVAAARTKIAGIYMQLRKAQAKRVSSKTALQALINQSKAADVKIEEYANALECNILGRALVIASHVVPRNAEDAQAANAEKSPFNLYYGLLCVNGSAVHPVAARYLLYRVREQMLRIMAGKDSPETAKPKSAAILRNELKLVFDKKGDNEETTVEMQAKDLSESFILFRGANTKSAVSRYADKLQSVANSIMQASTDKLRNEVFKQVLVVVEKLIEQYEGLFDNLGQYKTEIQSTVEQEAVRHESSADNRCIFVNASRKAKEYLYTGDLRTHELLEKGDEEINSAAGQGVYESLITRTWKIMKKEEAMQITGYQLPDEKDKFDDMGSVFTNVMRIYRRYLEEHAIHLNGSAIHALVSDICQRLHISRSDLTKHVNKVRVQTAFTEIINDMINKAKPMLNFDVENKDTYYDGESTDDKVSTTVYKHLTLSPAQLEDLREIYGGDAKAALEKFEKEFRPSRGAIVNKNLSDYELICFQAVHCLQPTQIRKFHEDNINGYYPYYKSRLKELADSRQLSESPHLDKRWHLREAMPYISRTMEQRWIAKTAKAFINELLNKKFKFTVDSDGIICFTYQKKNSSNDVHVYWPEERLVTINDISRLLEFLQEFDARVEECCDELDTTLQNVKESVSNYTDTMAKYKRALTVNEVLTDLRSNLLLRKKDLSTKTLGHGKNSVTGSKNKPDATADAAALTDKLGLEALDPLDIENSKGGILSIAWLVHQTEERQRRDYDYGEAILRCIQEIIDSLCANMYPTDISKDSDDYAEYRDLYNSIMEKFMESFVLRILAQLKKLDPDLLKNDNCVRYYRYLNIPETVLNTQDFKWLTMHWQLKK